MRHHRPRGTFRRDPLVIPVPDTVAKSAAAHGDSVNTIIYGPARVSSSGKAYSAPHPSRIRVIAARVNARSQIPVSAQLVAEGLTQPF